MHKSGHHNSKLKSVFVGTNERRLLGIASLLCATALCTAPAWAQSASADAIDEVVVTARKVTEQAVEVPQSITAFSEKTIDTYRIQTFTDYATKVPSLGFSYGTGGLGYSTARTIAIRGISGSGTTAMYIDDTPVFDSMDPRVVDVERIEVLKGPQGTLFGEGSLGGTVRLITKRPIMGRTSLDYTAEVGGTSHGGSPDGGVNLIGNTTVVPDRVAVRALAFYQHTPGFVVRTYPDPSNPGGRLSVGDQGAHTDFGGSLSVLVKVTDNFDMTARVLYQNGHNAGLPAVYAPLPGFVPVSLTNDRAANIQEHADDRWYLPSLQLNYHGKGFEVVSSTNYFSRHTDDLEDGTEGTYQAAAQFFGFVGAPQASAWPSYNDTQRIVQETRVSFDEIYHVSGTLGVYYSNTKGSGRLGPNYIPGLAAQGIYSNDLDWDSFANSNSTSKAVFGELYIHLPAKFTLTVGARKYWQDQTTSGTGDGVFNGGFTVLNGQSHETGVSPKVALEYKIDDNTGAYISASKGFRPGGAGSKLPDFCASGLAAIGLTPTSAGSYQSDTVWNYEIGAKSQMLNRRLFVAGSVFQQDWEGIQQTLFIPSCGFTFRGNAGAARSRGAELEASGRILPPLTVRIGLGYNDSRITSQGSSGQAVGTRVRQTPAFTASAGFEYVRPLMGQLNGFVSGDYSHTGNSLSSTSSASAVLVRPPYDVVNGRAGVRWGTSEVSLFFKNMTNADPNLGDLNPISYSRYVIVDGKRTVLPRVATLLPSTIGIQIKGSF